MTPSGQSSSSQMAAADSSLGPSKGSSEEQPLSRRHTLPPCRVCGAQAKGFHYGANTCEACKGFFRRSVLRKVAYVCLNDPIRCKVKPGMRKNCAACRYKRCLQVGMSLEAIRIGRYTTEKKNRDIQELKEYEAQLQQGGPSASKEIKEEMSSEDLVKVLGELEKRHCKAIEDLMESIENDQKSYLIRCETERSIFGMSGPVHLKQFSTIYKATGLKIDDRMEVLETLLPFLEKGLKKHVSYAKDLPGFKELPIKDQLNIIKNTAVETWIIHRYFCINTEHNLFTANDEDDNKQGSFLTFDMGKVFGEEWCEIVPFIAERIKKLGLSPLENVLVKVFCMFFPDRCELEARDRVEAIHTRITQALLHLLRKNHPQQHMRLFARIMAVITELRTLGYVCIKKFEDTPLSLVPDTHFPPLLKEVLEPTDPSTTDYPRQLTCPHCNDTRCLTKVGVAPPAPDPFPVPSFFSQMVGPVRQRLAQDSSEDDLLLDLMFDPQFLGLNNSPSEGPAPVQEVNGEDPPPSPTNLTTLEQSGYSIPQLDGQADDLGVTILTL